jgi:hypothetical protein
LSLLRLSIISSEIDELKQIKQEIMFKKPLNNLHDNLIDHVPKQSKKQLVKRLSNSKLSSFKRSLVIPDTQISESNDDTDDDNNTLLFIFN